MLEEEIYNSYDAIKPDETTKKRMLQNIQSTALYRTVAEKKERKARKNTKLLLRFAPVLAAILIVTTVSCTSYFFSLRDLGLGKEEVKIINLPQTEISDDNPQTPQTSIEKVDIISLAGLWNSPEYKACAEWEKFLQTYDQDGAILSSIGNGPTGLDTSYDAYLCYTQEMADKIDEICEKYQLSKLLGIQVTEDYDTLCRLTGIGDILTAPSEHANLSTFGGYLYTDGTFHMEGSAILAGESLCTTDFQFMRSMKGSFHTVTLNVKDISQYRQWNYTNKSGNTVLLANSDTKALIIVEREKSFIVVNVLGDILSDTFDITEETLEILADAFDFSAIP